MQAAAISAENEQVVHQQDQPAHQRHIGQQPPDQVAFEQHVPQIGDLAVQVDDGDFQQPLAHRLAIVLQQATVDDEEGRHAHHKIQQLHTQAGRSAFDECRVSAGEEGHQHRHQAHDQAIDQHRAKTYPTRSEHEFRRAIGREFRLRRLVGVLQIVHGASPCSD
ncbi:hypothetical protein D3C78_1385410 [compost metagenome]